MSTHLPEDKLRLGRALLAAGPVTHEQLQAEMERAGKTDSVLGKALLNAGFPLEQELIVALLSRLRIPRINAKNTRIPLETVRALPLEAARKARALALDQMGEVLVVVTPNATNAEGLAELRRTVGRPIFPIQSDTRSCSNEEFDGIIEDYYRRLAEAGLEPVAPLVPASAAAGAPTHHGSNGAAPPASGALRVIPLGSRAEDRFYRLYMTAGPVPAAARS